MNEIVEHQGGAPSLVQHLVRAEIDMQISTAHQYPRSLTKISRNVLSLVTISAKAAEKCTYALPRGGKPITGPSIRLAEIVASQYGNCRIGARVVHVDRVEKYIEAEGIFHDLETNTATTARVRRRISDRNGKLLNDDMIIVTGNAACSIAKRNAIFGGVPEALWGEAYEQALATIRGDVKTLPERRQAAMKAMAAFGLKPDQVYAILGVAGEKDVDLDKLVILGGMHSALKNEETTVEELLKTVEGDAPPTKGQVNVIKRPDPEPATVKENLTPQPEAKEEPKAASDAIAEEAARVAKEREAKADTPGPDKSVFQDLYNTIVNDLLEAPADEVRALYADQIAAMRAAFPDMAERLEDEFAAAETETKE